MLRNNGFQELKIPENLPSGEILKVTRVFTSNNQQPTALPEEKMEEEPTTTALPDPREMGSN